MKKKITIMLTTVLASLFLFSGLAFGEYYNRDNGYDRYDYDDYEYRFDNVVYHLDRYHGPVYYFRHDRADVYFVLVGDITFVVPAYTLRPYLHRHNFVWVPRTRFISLSCFGLDYYDSHLRFNFYFDFYNRRQWNRRNHHQLRRDFRSYYNGRKHHKGYNTNRRRIMQQRRVNSHNRGNSYSVQERQRIDGYKKYKHYKQSDNRNHRNSNSSSKKYYNNRNHRNSNSSLKKHYNNRNQRNSNSSSKKHYNNRNQRNSNSSSKKHYNNRNYKNPKSSQKKFYKGSGNNKKHVKSRNKRKQNSRYSKRDRTKRKTEKR